MKEYGTRTSETVREAGLYASDCCGEEVLFAKDASFRRCPRCKRLCAWETVDLPAVGAPIKQGTEQAPAGRRGVSLRLSMEGRRKT
jgi:hypothetical protein